LARRPFGEPLRFSHYFNVDPAQLDANGAFDVRLRVDERLLIDPKLLDESAVEEMRGAYGSIHEHFARILTLLKKSKREGDALWRSALGRFDFPEFRAAALGYARASTRGRGWSDDERVRTLRTASEIVAAGLEDPTIFELASLLEEGIGADHISDMFGNLLAERLAAFTTRVCDRLGVPTEDQRLGGRTYRLPGYVEEGHRRPVVLVPEDVLSRIPLAMDRSEIAEVVAANAELRAYVNGKVGAGWVEAARASQRSARAIFRHPDVLRRTIAEYRTAKSKRYDYTRDPGRHERIVQATRRTLADQALRLYLGHRPSPEEVYEVVGEIVADFKHHVENGRLRELLFVGDNMRPENYLQAALQTVAAIHCDYNDLDLSPEVNAGRGSVDFKFSRGSTRKVVVEMKLSEHKQLAHHYQRQVAAYREAEKTPYSYFVVLDDGRHKLAIERLRAAAVKARCDLSEAPGLVVVDGRKRTPASKL
jgi:hypothetical protein